MTNRFILLKCIFRTRYSVHFKHNIQSPINTLSTDKDFICQPNCPIQNYNFRFIKTSFAIDDRQTNKTTNSSVKVDTPKPIVSNDGRSYKSFWILTKPRLSMFVAFSAFAGAYLNPGSDLATMILSTTGVFLCSASANTLNQILEIPFDSQMARTKSRPLVTGKILPNEALAFSVICGIGGVAMLQQCSLAASLLGLANIGFYAFIYTPLKRKTIYNTQIGGIVGALPPLIGWTAVSGIDNIGGGIGLAMFLYFWQMVHFKALSWNMRGDYGRAGYQMSSVLAPIKCKSIAFRNSLFLLGSCIFNYAQIGASPWCLVGSVVPCFVVIYYSYIFKKVSYNDSSKAARALNLSVLVTLLISLGFMCLGKEKAHDLYESLPSVSCQPQVLIKS